mgnify:FL=1
MSYSKDSVKEKLDIEDIYTLLEYFGAEPEYNGDNIVCKTICHDGDSRKLYYYENTSLFTCYTHCGTFDIFELIQKVKGLDDLNNAIFFVVNFLNMQSEIDEIDDIEYSADMKVFARYEHQSEISDKSILLDKMVLDEYDLSIIKHYPQFRIKSWEEDNISKEVCDYMGIRYDPVDGNILIPHLDEDGRCIGIRQRTLVQENEKYGKYKPWRHQGKMYNHPLAFNLYGLYNAKDRIQQMQTAVIAESEKAVLQYQTYFGTANNICVAACGSSISRYQFELLEKLGIKEMVIAFDHDFEDYNSKESLDVQEKIARIAKKFTANVNVSVLIDKEGVLPYKASPLDMGKETFLYLFRNRIML